MKIKIYSGFAALVIILAGLFYACGGGGGGTQSGTVALYLTDDISDYQQVTATVNKVQLLKTGSTTTCVILADPVTVDLTNLAGVMQLVNVSSCPAVPYNRIHIEFAKAVELTNEAGSTSSCDFTSYRVDAQSKPNVLLCGPASCSLDINGALNVLVRQQHMLGLDFDLKNFSVSDFGTPACAVTMKISPLHASDMDKIKHLKAVTGLVSGLSTTDRTFTLTRGHTSFSVLYSGITGSQQPGLDTLLQRAQDDRLRVKVMASDFDLETKLITASAVFAKVEGRIGAGSLDPVAHTLSVVYSAGTGTKSIDVDYGAAVVEGVLAEGAWVDVKLYGYTSGWFLARKVEVESDGTITED